MLRFVNVFQYSSLGTVRPYCNILTVLVCENQSLKMFQKVSRQWIAIQFKFLLCLVNENVHSLYNDNRKDDNTIIISFVDRAVQ